ncbi:ExeA family protein [Ferrimonas marina]|uniref:MSHA biogenesis protein MshM n=1 Tax=Ferrimonas marina TaxID=299255 RepID=A0A1M5Y0P9_9GAMM|nr:AAA family ATPase [Ferrimonas marina]SHI05519.1 MSHA biogenesis protein MshM [Ferrimonas marina]
MYLYHFGLNRLPFALTPNTQFYCELPPHQEALQVLHTALAAGEGFIKVTGEVGTGKTLLCRKLINDLSDRFQIAYLPNPYLTPDEMRRHVASELGLDAEGDQGQLTARISEKLLQCAMNNTPVVLVLDEAQALPDDTLEALRLFTNLETETFKLLQVVMFGQPELDQRLAQSHLRQLRQRITFAYNLRGLSEDEVDAYLNHRAGVAGFQGQPLFSETVVRLLWRASGGIPRLLNVLAHKSLILAYADGCQQLGTGQIRRAVEDTEAANPLRFWDGILFARVAQLTLAGGVLGLLVLGMALRLNLGASA